MLRGAVAAGLLAALAPPAAADLAEYGGNVVGKAKAGLNGIVTFAADPVVATARPREEFGEMPGGSVLQYPLGLLQGMTLGVWRGVSGVWDLAFCWFTSMERVGPEPRYDLFAGSDEEFHPGSAGRVRVGPQR